MSSNIAPVEQHIGPLSGTRVLDLSRLLPGPYATQLLRDLGAEVIKVEDSDGGDYARYYPPLLADSNSASFHALNRGKKSVIVNLKQDSGKQQLHALLATSHVLVESFRPGVLSKLGFAPADLLKRYPALVICSISGYGQTGPLSQRAGHDMNYLARAGVLGMMKSPAVLPVQVADICGGSWPAVVQILAALRHAERTGKGSVIDVSMTDAAYSLLVMAQAKHAANNEPVGAGRDVLCGAFPCYDVYETADGHITVGNLEPKFWSSFVKAIGLKHLRDDAFAEGDAGTAVRAELQKTLKTKTNAQWSELLAPVDTCVEPVYAPEQRSKQDAQLAARQLDIDVAVGGKTISLVKTPLCMTGVQHASTAGPKIGEHTKQIFGSSSVKSKL